MAKRARIIPNIVSIEKVWVWELYDAWFIKLYCMFLEQVILAYYFSQIMDWDLELEYWNKSYQNSIYREGLCLSYSYKVSIGQYRRVSGNCVSIFQCSNLGALFQFWRFYGNSNVAYEYNGHSLNQVQILVATFSTL